MPVEFEDWLKAAQPYTDFYTDDRIEATSDIEIDHKDPVSKGGTFGLSNLVMTTKRNNQAKGDMTAREYISLLKLLAKWPVESKETLLTRLIRANCTFGRRRWR